MRQFIGGYSCGKDGARIIFYDCDPEKNRKCKKRSCELLGRGFSGSWCVATTNKAASREGAKPYYMKLDRSGPEISFVREYIEEGENERM